MENRTIMLQEVRKMKFEELNERYQRSELTSEQAAEYLCCSERTFRRMRFRYEEDRENGLADRRIGHAPPNKVAVDEIEKMISLYKETYHDFSIQHFYEQLKKKHDCARSYNFVRLTLQDRGCILPHKPRRKHRLKRVRKPIPGMMIHQDGSTHEWIAGLDYMPDLIITMDDATNEIYSAFLVQEEGTNSTMRGIRETIEKKGIFSSFYTDRGSHFATTPIAGGKIDKNNPTQVGRALAQLGIQHICAYSPEARGRSERMFGTWQKRLPQELRVAGITTVSAANDYIQEVFLPEFNESFMVTAEEQGNAFIPYIGQSLQDIFCIQEERTVNKDNTVSYKNIILQIPADEYRYHYVKCKVRVLEYPNGNMALSHGPRKLATYDNKGNLLKSMEENHKTPPLTARAA